MDTLKTEKILADVGSLIWDNQQLEGRIKNLQDEVRQLKTRVEDLQFQLANQENYYRGWLRRNVPYEDAKMTQKELAAKEKMVIKKENLFKKLWRRIENWGK